MRTLLALTALVASAVFGAPVPDDDTSRVADIRDDTGTTTHVSGLHYCYEEPEGGEVYINKYDNFFVQRGEAVIQVYFENMDAISFDSPVKEKAGRRWREATVRTRSGKHVEVDLICHPGCFIKGNVDLGEFHLDLEKVKEMVFDRKTAQKPRGFETRLISRAETPEGTMAVLLFADGSLKIEGRDGEATLDTLKKDLSQSGYTVFIRAEAQVPYSVLRKSLEILRDAGAKSILLGP